jgi:hypothetical protein
MSKIALSGNPSGSGTLTIASPNTNTDRTLVLPDEAGMVATSGISGVNSVPVGRGAGNVSTNTAVGSSALAANTTGAQNTAFGLEALKSNTTADWNSAFGRTSLTANTTGANNTGLGGYTLNANTTGGNNTAVGMSALISNTTASENIAVGYQSAFSNTTGIRNTAVGVTALFTNTTGNTNDAFGYKALEKSTTSSNNVALGAFSLQDNTTGTANTASGQAALNKNTTGSNNTAHGYFALNSNTTANNNTAVGFQAGFSNTTGTANTFLGTQCAFSNSTGSQNTFIGQQSGETMTTGSKNTILGRYNGNQGGLDIRTANNHIVLSDGDGNPRGYFNDLGNFVITRTTFSSIQAVGCYTDTTGSAANMHILSSGSIVRSTSSRKYKTDIQDATHGLAEVMQLRPVTYKGTGNHDGQQVLGGLIAEEVHDAGLTEFVQYADDGTPDALAYGHMVSLCVKAIQELNAKVEALETQLKGTQP